MMRWKIKDRLKNTKKASNSTKNTTALAQRRIETDFKTNKKLENYIKSKQAIKYKTIKIIINENPINGTKHLIHDKRWNYMLNKKWREQVYKVGE